MCFCFYRINSLVQGDDHATHRHEAGHGSVKNSISLVINLVYFKCKNNLFRMRTISIIII